MAPNDKERTFLRRLIYPPGVNPLPTNVCLILFVNLMLNSTTLTMAFAFLPKMMKTFGKSEVDVGYYAGWVASSLFIARIISSTFWGLLIDKFGARPVSLVAPLCLSVTTIMFGFSYSFYWALFTRSMQGLSMGLIISSKSILFEVSDNTNQPYGMVLITTAFTTGLVLGPSLGGLLVLPKETYPEGSIFGKFIFLLPNLVIGLLIGACAFLLLLLPKTGLLTTSKSPEGEKILGDSSGFKSYGSSSHDFTKQVQDVEEYWNLSVLSVDKQSWVGNGNMGGGGGQQSPDVLLVDLDRTYISANKNTGLSKFLRLFKNKDVMMTCGLYLLYSFASIGSDELFSVWAATDRSYYGLGFTPSQVGLQLLTSCLLMLLTYPLLSTRITNNLGAKKAMICSTLILVVVASLYPSTSTIENRTGTRILVAALSYLSQGCSNLCFTAINIFQNNSVHRDQLGVVNGLGNTASAMGRSVSPIVVGSIYSWSLKNINSVYKDGLGFPFNNYLAFLFLSFCFLMSAVWTAFIPDYLNFRKDSREAIMLADKNGENSKQSFMQVSVSTFTYGSQLS